MGGIAALLVALGIVGLIYALMNKLKAGRVSDAPFVSTGDVAQKGKAVASQKGAVSFQGDVRCDEPLIAPVSGAPCLYYELKCTAKWKEGDHHKEKEIEKRKAAARFAIDDGSGQVWVDAEEGGDFEPEETTRQEKSSGLIGGITGQDIVFGQYAVSPGLLVGLGRTYVVEEKHVPLKPRMYVCGVVGEQPGVVTSPKWRNLIMSDKSRDELLGKAQSVAKISFIVGGALIGVGAIVGVVSMFVGGSPKEDPSAAKGAASTSAKAAPAKPPAKK